jgi:hypothetical protein
MNDNELKQKLQDSLQSIQSDDVLEFDAVWADAETRHHASRLRYARIAGIATAAAIAVMAFMIWPLNGDNMTGNYLTEEDLMSSTQWLAPSDVLLPDHRFDIYGELPVLINTNDLDEGSLL